MENLRCAVCGQFVTDGDYRLIVVGKPDEGVRVHYKCMDRMPMWMRILHYLRENGSITQEEVLRVFPHPYKSWRLSEYIRVLRREKGINIRTEDMPREHNSPLAKYILED